MLNSQFRRTFRALLIISALTALPWSALAASPQEQSQTVHFRAPAGDLPTTREIFIDGLRAAILPNGRFITPAGVEVNVDAPSLSASPCLPTVKRSRRSTAARRGFLSASSETRTRRYPPFSV